MQTVDKDRNYYSFININLQLIRYVVFFVVLTSITIFINNKILDIHREQLHSQANHLLIMMSSRQEMMIDQNKSLLNVMSLMPEITSLKAEECNSAMSDLLKKNPSIVNLGLLNSAGDVVCSALNYSPGTTGKDRPYFINSMKTGDFSLGEYQIGRITKKQSLNFGYPLKDESGKPHAVLFSAIGLTWFQDQINELQIQNGDWKIVITDRNGTILAGHPPDTMKPGSSGLDASLLSAILSNRPGPTFIKDSDGVKRLYVYTTLLKSEEKPSNYIIVGADIGRIERSINLIIWSGYCIIMALFICVMYLSDQVRVKNRAIKDSGSK